jgi:alkaline phosphatase
MMLFLITIGHVKPAAGVIFQSDDAKYVFVFIGDGMGANQLEAANLYTTQIPTYQSWSQSWMATYPYGGSYDPLQAWQNHNYVSLEPTDSAAAATALFSGMKTTNGKVNVSPDSSMRYQIITESARSRGYAIGAVTTVPISHATPAGWFAHNSSRSNGFAIANEGIWGNPNTTGTPSLPFYDGGYGVTFPPVDVMIGGGHPSWFSNNNNYVDEAILTKLSIESGVSGKPVFVQRIANHPDGGARLLTTASASATRKLVGIFGGSNGDFEYQLADGSGREPENPTLAEMTQAAIEVLQRNPFGFLLLVEGGSIDHAAHANNMNELIGEVIGFNEAVQTAINWVEDPNTPSNWENTLFIVTADHETGYLTKAPDEFANVPLGMVTPTTIAMEKVISSTGRRASWQDLDSDSEIDPTEEVYWTWNSGGHTNSLVRFFIKGQGSDKLGLFLTGYDTVRGAYLDNTSVFNLIQNVLLQTHHNYLPFITTTGQ